MSGAGNWRPARDGWRCRGPEGSGPPAAALKYRSASEPSRRKMQWIGGDGRSGRSPERPPARRFRGSRRSMPRRPADLCRAPRQSTIWFAKKSTNTPRSARAAQVRVHERCTTAAPKRVTLATKHVTTARHKSFC